jgi:predicted alpha/beta hydrolase family esterase
MASTLTDAAPPGPVLTVPGLGCSGPEHWQSRWEASAPVAFRRVEQRDWDRPDLDGWRRALEDAVVAAGPSALLAAHSLSCSLVAHWARTTRRAVRGALLVAPADLDAPSAPPETVGFRPMPLERLPFPSILVASDDDPYATLARAEAFATAWGSRLVVVRGGGHLNAQSRLGDWPAGLALLRELRR